jgi:hypothetical protein
MVNNSTNINKTNNHLLLQLNEHKKDHGKTWNSRSWRGTVTTYGKIKPVNGILSS